MKTAMNHTVGTTQTLHRDSYFSFTDRDRTINVRFPDRDTKGNMLTPAAAYQMATGQLPDLWEFCHTIQTLLDELEAPYSANDFLQALQGLQPLDGEQVRSFVKNKEPRHVLISNDHIDVVLIHWKPGKASDVHGHQGNGCLFKLIQGKLEELRYTPERSPKLMGFKSYKSGDLAYIDDRIAYHQVGNPYGSSAISLHLYIK